MTYRFVLISLIAISLLLVSAGTLAEDKSKEPEYQMEVNGWQLASILTGGIHVTEYQDWQAGGSDTVAFNARYEFWARQSSVKHEWKNRIRLEYGISRSDDDDFRASSDILQMDTRFEYKLNPRFFVYLRGYVATHMGNQYDYFDEGTDIILFDEPVEQQVTKTRIADGFDPIKLEEGAGFGWVWFENEDKSDSIVLLAGVGTRQLLSDNYYIEDDNPITPELEYENVQDYSAIGAEGVIDVTWTFHKTAKFTSHGAAFYGFDNEQWSGRWENALNLKITEYIGVNIGAEMLYDEAIFDGEQWKLSTMLTLNYRVF